MNILSLFDGMSCGQIALNKLGITDYTYYASEVDKYAIKVTQSNYPDTIQLGDIRGIKASDLPPIDVIWGGSPCQGFSFAGKQLNFEDSRSVLFFEFVRLVKECKPKYFLLENVRMKKEYQDVITQYMGVEPIKVNSALVSAQNRVRLYWTNIPLITQPRDRCILMKDILQYNVGKQFYLGDSWLRWWNKNKESRLKKKYSVINPIKAITVTARQYANWNGNFIENEEGIRKLTPIECERLQTVPDSYTNHVSNSQRYKMLGNGWTVDLIVHILKHIRPFLDGKVNLK